MKRSYIIGLDTGGTYTDGVIVDREERKVLCKAKALTSRPDLSEGIRSVLHALDPALLQDVGLVCLSTTLATNAIVEGTGSRVGLVIINPDAESKDYGADIVIRAGGQMDIKGNELAPVSGDVLRALLGEFDGKVDAVAVSGFASVRNPAQEQQVKGLTRELLGLPVVCGSELTNVLGFEERTVTAVLNARLISKIRDLIAAVRGALAELGIGAPVMVVKGDGSLMSADQAEERPVETIMSGPAASVIGGLFLSGKDDGVVVDIGGTTTDIARLHDRRVSLCPEGATCGGWQTRVKAIQMYTHGLGGDSWCRIHEDGRIGFGPQRVVPLCVVAEKDPHLTGELHFYRRGDMHEGAGIFWADCVRLTGRKDLDEETLNRQDGRVLQLLEDGAHSVFYLEEKIGKKAKFLSLARLQRSGWIEKCSLTPTDLLHAEGSFVCWEAAASKAAVDTVSSRLNMSAGEFIRKAKKQFLDQLAYDIASSALRLGSTGQAAGPLDHPLLRQAICGGEGLLEMSLRLRAPLIGLGAPTGAWLPDVRGRIETEVILPDHHEVANAVGAAVGEIHEEFETMIQFDPFKERFLVFSPQGKENCKTLKKAVSMAREKGEAACRKIVREQRLEDYEISCREDIRYRNPLDESEWDILDSYVTVTLRGRPLRTV